MSTVLTELVAELAFKTNKAELKEFDNTLNQVKKNFKDFLGAAGFGLAVKKGAEIDDTFRKIMRSLSFQLDDKGTLATLENQLESIKKKTKSIFSNVELAQSMKELWTMTSRDVSKTGKALEYAVRFAEGLGVSLEEATQQFKSFVKSGDTNFLQNVGQFTSEQLNELKLRDISFDQIQVEERRIELLFDFLQKNKKKIIEIQKEGREDYGNSLTNFLSRLEDAAQQIGKVLSPAVKTVFDSFSQLIQLFTDTKSGKAILEIGTWGVTFAALATTMSKVTPLILGLITPFAKKMLIIAGAVLTVRDVFKYLAGTKEESERTVSHNLVEGAKNTFKSGNTSGTTAYTGAKGVDVEKFKRKDIEALKNWVGSFTAFFRNSFVNYHLGGIQGKPIDFQKPQDKNKNITQNNNPTINVVVQGNANEETVKAITSTVEQIVEEKILNPANQHILAGVR